MYNLDLKDKKILFELDFNARQSYSEIGKKTGLSKQVVEYRVNNLIKEGVITGFYPVVNVPKLGYFYCRLTLTLQNIGSDELDEMMQSIKNDGRVFWLFETQGDFDIFFGTWFESLAEFRKYIDSFMSRYSQYVKYKVENVATDVIHYQHRYLLGKTETAEIHIKESKEKIQIDELDKNILKVLCADGRISLVLMGKQLNEHPKTLAYRIRRMEKIKLIETYRVGIDHNKLGFTYYKIFLNASGFSANEFTRLKEYIKRNPATIYLVEGIGLHADIDFEMMVKNNKELFDFVKLLKREFPKIIQNYSTVIFINTITLRYLPF